MSELRTTPTQLRPIEPIRRRFDPTLLFAQRDRLPWFWFLVAVATAAGTAFERYHLVQTFKHRERVVIVDPSQTYHLSPLLQFQEAGQLHVQQAELATLALLQRNPKDFDQPELLKQMFLKPAYEKAQEQRLQEGPEVRSKQLHQKPEIAKIEILSTREETVLAQVNGQVIRNGIFGDNVFVESFTFQLTLHLLRNPNMALNGRFPMAVTDFNYELTK